MVLRSSLSPGSRALALRSSARWRASQRLLDQAEDVIRGAPDLGHLAACRAATWPTGAKAPIMTPAATLGVMNSSVDRDARTVRVVRLAEASPDRSVPAAAPVSPDAARARRYRARKRGEDVPKRKPGPEPRSVTALSREVDALRRENARLAAEVAESRKLTPMLGMRRQRFTLGMAGQLRAALEASDPAKDAPALREALRDLGAAIEARHDHWPE